MNFVDDARSQGLVPVISHIHLIEISRSSDPSRFIPRLQSLKPGLFRSREADFPDDFSRELIEDYDARSMIEGYIRDFASIQLTMIMAHLPMLKLLGGLKEVSAKELLERYTGLLETIIGAVAEKVTLQEMDELNLQSQSSTEEIREEWRLIDFSEHARQAGDIRSLLRSHGEIHQLPSHHLVEAVKSILEPDFPGIFAEYPPHFAQRGGNVPVNISALCTLLYFLGAVPQSGKILRGSEDRQKNTLFGQILDSYHIGEATCAMIFATFDKNAARLAASVYSYAGISTKVIHLQDKSQTPNIPSDNTD